MSRLEPWVRAIPRSTIGYPESWGERAKYYLWRMLTPLHPYVRDTLSLLGIVDRRYLQYRPSGRQRFLLGHLAPGVTPQALASYLVEQGYGNHFVALRDAGEVVGLRYAPDFTHQYHIRIFKDGEVRGHYEYTVECHPFLHDKEVDFEDRREYFLKLLGDRIIPASE